MNSMPFRQLKSFLKILIGVQYEIYFLTVNDRNFDDLTKLFENPAPELCGAYLNIFAGYC